MRTVANENENVNGSMNDPNPLSTSSTGSGIGPKANKVSTKEKAQPKTDLPIPFNIFYEIFLIDNIHSTIFVLVCS